MRHIIAVVLIALGMSGALFPATAQMKGTPDVIDGDTLSFHIRIFGIDTPEKRQRCEKDGGCYLCGLEALTVLKTLLDADQRGHARKTVTCAFTAGVTHGRPVASCKVGGEDIGEQIRRLGW